MKYFEKVANYEDAIMEKTALSDAAKHRIGQGLSMGADTIGGAGLGSLLGLAYAKERLRREEKKGTLRSLDEAQKMIDKYYNRGGAIGAVAGGGLHLAELYRTRRKYR